MITHLSIRDLGVIEAADLPLGPGLTVLTGETGAGKTMVVTALGLLMGRRAEPSLVRSGAAGAVVEATVVTEPEGPVARRVIEAGGDLDAGELVLARRVPAEGRARAFAGGRAVPASLLSEVAEDLVAVHGQTDQLLLRSPARQRQLLDDYAAGLSGADPGLRPAYREAWRAWQQAARTLAELEQGRAERLREREDLAAGLDVLDAVAPEPEEDVRLAAEAARLRHGEEIRAAVVGAHAALLGEEDDAGAMPGALAALTAARHSLDAVRAHDSSLGVLADRLAELGYAVTDVAAELTAGAAGLDADPARLADVEARRQELNRLVRRHGGVSEALAWGERARARLLELDDADDEAGLARAEAQARERLDELAARLGAERRSAAESFAAAVTAELAELSLAHARLVVDVRAVEPGPDGADDVELRLAAHPGADPVPVARAASGGELSRVMLGVEVVVTAQHALPTFVFDEVDAGVGGAAALGIGRRLAKLASGAQVLVVTHLAQVAAFADSHLVVEKSTGPQRTVSTVTRVTGGEREREIARMLAGSTTSEAALAHAAELLSSCEAQVTAIRRTGAPVM